MKILFFILCAIYAFGGIVNVGFSDSIFAIPFIAALLWASFRWKGWFAVISCIFIVGICTPLYFLKKFESSLFYPANGKVIVLDRDAHIFCNSKPDTHPQNCQLSILCRYIDNHNQCLEKTISKGARFNVLDTYRIDIGAPNPLYNLLLLGNDIRTEMLVSIDQTPPFTFTDGIPVTIETITHPLFDAISNLMDIVQLAIGVLLMILCLIFVWISL